MEDFTRKFNAEKEKDAEIHHILTTVYAALEDKGYMTAEERDYGLQFAEDVKLDSFIAQEMGREINTLGSKSNHAEMQNIVVKMKDELEQIKEQVLNVM